MSKDCFNFQIDIPCKDCPMSPVCTNNVFLSNAIQFKKDLKSIDIRDKWNQKKTYPVPIPKSNSDTLSVNFYIMCKYRTENPKERIDGNFRSSIPCSNCVFSKNCKYGPYYINVPSATDVENLCFRHDYHSDPSIPDNDSLSYFLSVHCNCKGGLDHDPA